MKILTLKITLFGFLKVEGKKMVLGVWIDYIDFVLVLFGYYIDFGYCIIYFWTVVVRSLSII